MSNDNTAAIHYVCTYDEGKSLLAAQQEFSLRTCGCRARNPLQHADNNCCLWFTTDYQEEQAYSEQITVRTRQSCWSRQKATVWFFVHFGILTAMKRGDRHLLLLHLLLQLFPG